MNNEVCVVNTTITTALTNPLSETIDHSYVSAPDKNKQNTSLIISQDFLISADLVHRRSLGPQLYCFQIHTATEIWALFNHLINILLFISSFAFVQHVQFPAVSRRIKQM